GPLWERANRDQDTTLLAPGTPHPAGPAAVAVAARQPGPAAPLAGLAQTPAGLAIIVRRLPRGHTWLAGPGIAAWVRAGSLRVEGAAGDVTARTGQLVTFGCAALPARVVALTAATLLVLSN